MDFAGPFSWSGAPDAPSLYSDDVGSWRGIYFWTIPAPDGYLVYYVGETGRSFADRMTEHWSEHASGFYHLYDAEEFARGNKLMIWPGKYDPQQRRTVRECIEAYSTLAPCVAELAKLYRFFVAELDADRRLRQRVEAALAKHFNACEGVVGSLQDQGIRYSLRSGTEQPISCRLASSVPIQGLPSSLEV